METRDIQVEVKERVEREKRAHNDDDVLHNSKQVKKLLWHTEVSPARKRMDSDFERLLSSVAGKRVLDIGCGHGEQSLDLLRRGASVVGIDISDKYVDIAAKSAQAAGYDKTKFQFQVMDAHALTFPDGSFDLVVGRGILHHLSLQLCLAEIRRVLKPGGRAVFIEPLLENLLLKVFRRLTPSCRTVDERPLSREDLNDIEKEWKVESSYYGIFSAPVAVLTSVLLRPFPNNPLLKAADAVEQRLNHRRSMHPYNQYVLLNLVKE